MQGSKQLAVLIPCFNEERGIADVISSFPHEKLRRHGIEARVMVIDNASTDRTAEVARSLGATVLHEPKQGKGHAMRRGFASIGPDVDYVAMLDGDGTYRGEEIVRLVELLDSGFCDAVVGSRLGGNVTDGSMRYFNRIGNWMFTFLVRVAYRVNVTDVLTGYFAWTRGAIKQLSPHLRSGGFAIEMEMVTKMAKLGHRIYSVPVTYDVRHGHSNLRPIRDGLRILRMFARSLLWRPPKTRAHPARLLGRVLMIAHHYPPHVGGLEVVAQDQARMLTAAGYRVTVITSRAGTAPRSRDGVRVVRVRAWHVLERFGVPFPLFSPLLPFTIFRHAWRSDAIHVHDVFYVSSWMGYLASVILRKPLILVQHVALVEHPSRLVNAVQHLVYATIGRLMFSRSSAIVVYNAIVRDFLCERGVDVAKLRVMRNGIDTTLFRPAQPGEKEALRRRYGLSLERPIALFVGRFVPKKGCDALFAARSEEYDIAFVGSGDVPSQWLQASRVRVLGSRTREELAELYRAADVFVLPTRGELFTLAMQEAMASGLPVVTTDEPAYATSGMDCTQVALCSPEPEQLRAVLVALAADAQRRQRMGDYARAFAVERFDRDRNGAELISLYGTLVTRRRQRTRPLVEGQQRVMIVTPYFHPRIGGVENYVYNMARTLREARIRVSIVTSNTQGSGYKRETLEGMTVHRLPISFTISNTPIGLSWFWRIRRIMRDEQPDIINAHSPVPFLSDVAALAAGSRPFVLTYHAGAMKKGRALIDTVIAVYESTFLRMLFRRADAVAPVSAAFFDMPARAAFVHKSTLIRPGVDMARFSPKPLPAGAPIVTYVGRIEHSSAWKGIEQLLRAFVHVRTAVPQARLELVGSGDALEQFRERAAQLGIANAVTFTGALHGAQIVRAYTRSSVVVLPSTTDAEQSSVTLIEAMASGRPVVATSVGGTPYIVEHEQSGLLVPPDDVDALAGAIVRIVRDRALAAALAKGAVASARAVGWDVQAARYRSLFDTLLLSPQASAVREAAPDQARTLRPV